MNLPDKRLIVLASVKNNQDLDVMYNAQPEAVMSSYWELRRSRGLEKYTRFVKRLRRIKSLRYRYLDSGAFTFINAAQRGKQSMDLAAFREFADSYVETMKDHGKDWDWIVEMDVDDVFGVEVAREYRERLREVVGDRLLPVWHETTGYEEWTKLLKEFPYVGIGSNEERKIKLTQERILVREAHSQGVIVHRFGTSSPAFMRSVPYDTCDSTGWLSAPRHRRFFQLSLTQKMSHRSLARARELRKRFEEIGYDYDEIVKLVNGKLGGESWVKASTVAALLYKQWQEELPPVRSIADNRVSVPVIKEPL